jgi:hypothetical protein
MKSALGVLSLSVLLLVSVGCGKDDAHGVVAKRKPVFPFSGVSLTNEDVDKNEISASIDVPAANTPLQPDPIPHKGMGRAPASAVDDVPRVTLTMTIDKDPSGAHTHDFAAADFTGPPPGIFLRDITLTCDGKVGQKYHLIGSMTVYVDPMDATKTKSMPIDVNI